MVQTASLTWNLRVLVSSPDYLQLVGFSSSTTRGSLSKVELGQASPAALVIPDSTASHLLIFWWALQARHHRPAIR
jgi:hypothetical protein